MQLRNVTYATALAIMLGWLLWIGKPILLPVIAAIVALYILSAAASSIRRLPFLRVAPLWLLRTVVLIGFTLAAVAIFTLIATSFARVAAAIPGYEQNLDALIGRGANLVGIDDEPSWERVREATLDRISGTRMIAPVAASLRGFGVTLFLVVLYASFFVSERVQFERKLRLAMGDTERGERALALLARINERVGQYLLVKTLVNVILGLISFAIMWLIGIEFALFWAVLIAFLNYIPYVGSLIGVLFPVLLSLAQSGSIAFALLALVTLTAAQVYVGGVLEPRMMGRAFNLSPFVVLLALAFWGALWGVPGAILSVPLTASLVIVLAEIRETRPAAILMSASGRV
ncbi:AI-2E family transporter [Roseitranquillus sediminis]|uniref:AI-2E family transporter n=1 Tax=Roseitranquillus sediminis TaxID=2809051 RepID=UPI001D0C8EC7|nr:AI-2E family transporter [Roseitranquillus sediminis]MBM9594270.1 AI-2E family transporter [Roseitranquillus sediminis]